MTSVESQLEAAVCYVAANLQDPVLRGEFLDQACAGDPACARRWKRCCGRTRRPNDSLRKAARR